MSPPALASRRPIRPTIRQRLGAPMISSLRHLAAGATIAVALLAAPSARAADFTVNDMADAADSTPGDALCRTAAGRCTLRAAVQEANSNVSSFDRIFFAAGMTSF